MSKLKFIWDKEEEKEEEKPGWLQRTGGIGELPELPTSTKLKFTGAVGLGLGAKATGGITLPGTTSIKPLIEGLPMSKPEDKPKTLLEQVGVKKPTTPEELKMGVETSLGTWEEQKKANPELQKMEDLAYEVLSIKGRDIPLESKDTHFFDIDIIKKGGSYTQEEAQIAYLYELLTTTEDKAGVPFNETIKDMQFNKIRYGDINPPKDWKKTFKEEGILKTAIIGPSDKYGQAESILRGLQDILFKKENPGLDYLSSFGMKGFLLLMGGQFTDTLLNTGFKVGPVKLNEKELTGVFRRAREALVPETGKFKSTLSDNDYAVMEHLNIFLKTTGKSPVAREMLEKIVEQTGGLTFPQRVNIFGGKLYAGLPADEIAKSIVAVGKVTAEAVKGLDPIKVSQVTQMLLNTSPALASEFLKAVEKPPITKEQEYAEKYGIPLEKIKVTELPKADVTKETVSEDTIKKLEELVGKGITPEEALKKVKEAVKPKEELKAKGKEPVIPVIPEYTPYEKMNMLKTGARVTRLKALYGYVGEGVEKVNINGKVISIDTAIKRTQQQSNLPELEKASEETLKAQPKPTTITPEPADQYTKVPATLTEAKEILKVDPKKPSQPKELLAKQMIAKKVSLADIEAVKGEKIDITKPKDILIALRDIKAVKKEVAAEPTPKAIPKELEPLAEEKYEEYGEVKDDIINEFESGKKNQTWEIIPKNKLFNIYKEQAEGLIKSEKDLDNIWLIFRENLQKILINSEILDSEYINDENLDKWNEYIADEEGHGKYSIDAYDKFNTALVKIDNAKTPQEKLLAIDYTLNLVHGIGSPAQWFIQSGTDTLDELSQIKEIKPAPITEAVTEQPAVVEAPAPAKPPIPPSPPTKAEMAGEPIGDPIAKLNELIKQAKPRRGRLETEYTKERAKRIAEVERAIDEIGGEQGYIVALSKLKGQLAPGFKFAFEPVKDKLSKPEIDALYNRTFKHPYLDEWEKISAANELTKLLSGEIPTPKGLVLLEEIYGTDLIKSILSKRALGLKIADVLIDVANVPRAILATADMSGFLRQGIVYVISHPVIATKAMGKTFQFAFNSKSFEQYFKDLPKDKLYPLMRKSGLAVTDPSRVLATGREEAFISRLMQQIPIIGQIIKFAERAYVGFLNKLRVDVFKTFADEFLSKGYSPVKDKDLFKATAEVVNTFTGRGSLGNLNRITPFLNTIFFSPRLIMARFNALNPIWYTRQPKEIRIKALGDFAKFVAVGLTLLAIIKASGLGDVETDPRSSDFGKIKIGNTRWDIWGGFQQWVRVFSQFITGKRKNTATGEIISLTKEDYPFTTRKEIVLRFIEGKLAPVPALINELISGAKTFEGEDITFETVVREKFIPMYIQDITDAYMDGGLGRAVGSGITAFFGVGVQTWQERKSKEPLKITMPEGGKLTFTKPKLDIQSTKLKFNF